MKRIYYIIIIVIALFSCEKPISHFQSENFFKLFGSGYESKGNDVIVLSDGGYLITGYDKVLDNSISAIKAFVAKVDKNGNTIWSKTYGQEKFRSEGKVIKEVADGYLIAGIYKDAGITNAIQHSFIRKIDFEGTEVFYWPIGDSGYNITVNDIVVDDKRIYIVGYSDVSSVGASDYYIAELDNLGKTLNGISDSPGMNCSFRKVFIKGEKLLLVGTDRTEGRIKVGPYLKSTMVPDGVMASLGTSNDQAVDAALVGEHLFLLSTDGSIKTKLSKLNSNSLDVVWTYSAPNTSVINAAAFAYQADGSVMVCGETGSADAALIHFIKINPDGTIFNSEEYFKTLGGSVGKIIETWDKGLIMVGSTTPTYGMNIQLIKTDKDYFMLKNN